MRHASIYIITINDVKHFLTTTYMDFAVNSFKATTSYV